MQKVKQENLTETGFLIDGYPRELGQGLLFEKNVSINIIIIKFFLFVNKQFLKILLKFYILKII